MFVSKDHDIILGKVTKLQQKNLCRFSVILQNHYGGTGPLPPIVIGFNIVFFLLWFVLTCRSILALPRYRLKFSISIKRTVLRLESYALFQRYVLRALLLSMIMTSTANIRGEDTDKMPFYQRLSFY